MKQIVLGVLAFFSSVKLWISLTGVALLWSVYWHTAYHTVKFAIEFDRDKAGILLPLLNDQFQTTMWGIVTIVVGLTGAQALQGFSRNTTSITTAIAESIFAKSESKEEIIYKEELERGD